MVLFYEVVEIFHLQNLDQPTPAIHHQQAIHIEQAGRVGSAFVDDNFVWPTVISNRFGKECGRRRLITPLRQHKIQSLALLVDRSIEIRPLTLKLDIGFIHSPRSTCGNLPAMAPAYFFNPPIERCVVHGDAALGYDFFEIAIRDAITNIKTDRVQDHRLWVMRAFEIDQRLNPDTGFGKRKH